MADDPKEPVVNPDDNPQDPPPEKTAEELAAETKEKRKAAIDKISIEGQRAAAARTPEPNQTQDDFEIDLEGVDKDQAKAIREALKKAKQVNDYAGQLADFGIKQARRAKAYEIASQFGAFEDVDDFEKALEGAATPKEIELSAKEIIIKLKEDGSFATPAVKPDTKTKTPPATDPKFDGGRGRGGNQSQALMDEIDAIDPTDPERDKKLAALKKRAEAAQERFVATNKK